MTNASQIPYLVKLLDDESEESQENVINELISFGPNLKEELKKIDFPINATQKTCLKLILEEQSRIWLKKVWPSWYTLASDYEKLESALSILAGFLSGNESVSGLKPLLDQLAARYNEDVKSSDPRALAKFLFMDKALKGNKSDYYNPQNSNLIYVINERRGIPISLTSVYMLVGHRLNMSIEGCQFPGHFLARIDRKGKKEFVDCFNSGQIVTEEEILKNNKADVDQIRNILLEKVETESIIHRYLVNLVHAYQTKEDEKNHQLMIALSQDLNNWLDDKDMIEKLNHDQTNTEMEIIFQPGQLVRHRRYGYRGIIVDFDLKLQAPNNWYYSNQTQPKRNQAWYHVLVDGSDQVTYAAQSNLLADSSSESVSHPFLDHFFTQSETGQYIRNDRTWPR